MCYTLLKKAHLVGDYFHLCAGLCLEGTCMDLILKECRETVSHFNPLIRPTSRLLDHMVLLNKARAAHFMQVT